MIYLLYIVPFLLISYTNGDINVNIIHDKLLSKIEHQFEELTKQQELQKAKINGFKRLLREEGINFTHISELNDENDIDPFGFSIIRNIKSDFELLKVFHTQVKSFNIAQEDKTEIKEDLLQGLRNYFGFSNNIGQPDKILQLPLTPTEQPKPQFGYCTPNTPFYTFFPVNDTKLTFKLRASNDGHIALVNKPVDVNPIYEVVLGGWANKRSVIRKDHTVEEAVFSHPSMLHDCEYIGFWIRWDAGLIQVGYEGNLKPFISYNVPNLYKVNYIGIHTGYGATGSWIF